MRQTVWVALMGVELGCSMAPPVDPAMASSSSAQRCPARFDLELEGEVVASRGGIVEIVDRAGHRTEWSAGEVCEDLDGVHVRRRVVGGGSSGSGSAIMGGGGAGDGTAWSPSQTHHAECGGPAACAGLVLICCGERPARAVGTCFALTECPGEELAAPPE